MANRSDSGSNSAHQNQRPTSHNEDALPEMTETRGRAQDEPDDDFDDEDVDRLDEDDEEDEEGSF